MGSDSLGPTISDIRTPTIGADGKREHSLAATAYLAAWLEGEGCFSIAWGTAGKLRCSPNVAAVSIDEDSLRTIHQLADCGALWPEANVRGISPSWKWQATGPDAIALMKRVLPFMHARRTEKIQGVIFGWNAWRAARAAGDVRKWGGARGGY